MAADSWEQLVTTLVAKRGEALTRYAYLVSGSADDAADLVQDALVKTFGRLRNGLSITSAEAYVRRAILNGHIDATRRRSRWRTISHLAAEPESHDSPAPAAEARLDLRGELMRLSPRERACIVLRYYDDLKVDDIAETLDISPGSVKRYLSDGLARLSISVKRDDEAEPLELTTPSGRTASQNRNAPSDAEGADNAQ
ncbi:RNA polymerase sigma factor (sigma-70 family) [Homoserinimonas aerilata]|uniref:RNA polymerase sigma factor (Sigma-70 family) n=1 Tax=Homoserinimonas aerilata TaxID=1162970 RepID=A0A542YKA6_9MICO|nr:SigE family RNA polymerase sigma factor [Homoserinimonas aerilata]TQL48533.1 RNA polymerase sigma factor (sigma-70 family) [Homoserinimonas aerilata]